MFMVWQASNNAAAQSTKGQSARTIERAIENASKLVNDTGTSLVYITRNGVTVWNSQRGIL